MNRLDKELVTRRLVSSRSQAENYIRLGYVRIEGAVATKAGQLVRPSQKIIVDIAEQLVSRAGLKLASVAADFAISFQDQVVLDIGSSTGGFTDFALRRGAKKVIAVDVGTDQLHPSLRHHPLIELHEKTDIRTFRTSEAIDLIVCDVSFISLEEILPHVARQLMHAETTLLAMVKPQFEATRQEINKGVIKNNRLRRDILSRFEQFAAEYFVTIAKRDSGVAGAKGNLERFYQLKRVKLLQKNQ